jgi:hypothetical protein
MTGFIARQIECLMAPLIAYLDQLEAEVHAIWVEYGDA